MLQLKSDLGLYLYQKLHVFLDWLAFHRFGDKWFLSSVIIEEVFNVFVPSLQNFILLQQNSAVFGFNATVNLDCKS